MHRSFDNNDNSTNESVKINNRKKREQHKKRRNESNGRIGKWLRVKTNGLFTVERCFVFKMRYTHAYNSLNVECAIYCCYK